MVRRPLLNKSAANNSRYHHPRESPPVWSDIDSVKNMQHLNDPQIRSHNPSLGLDNLGPLPNPRDDPSTHPPNVHKPSFSVTKTGGRPSSQIFPLNPTQPLQCERFPLLTSDISCTLCFAFLVGPSVSRSPGCLSNYFSNYCPGPQRSVEWREAARGGPAMR